VTENLAVCRGWNCKSQELIRSHIVPKAFARLARGDEGHVINISPNRRPAISKYQLGSFDPAILCASCDGKLGRFDDYTAEFCERFMDRHQPFSELGFQIPNVDTDLLQKGLLAILWRSSISNRPECKHVALGPYEERIRDILFDGSKVGVLSGFATVIQRYVVPSNTDPTFYFYPYRSKFDGLNVYILGLAGLRFLIKLDARPFSRVLEDFILGLSPTVVGTNIDFDETGEGRAMRRKANPLMKYRKQVKQTSPDE
jgi:hypothetical protein